MLGKTQDVTHSCNVYRVLALKVVGARGLSVSPRKVVKMNKDARTTEKEPLSAPKVSYGRDVVSYGAAKLMRFSTGIERNHIVPKAFLEKGPPETRHLGDYVPVLPLSFQEHRGRGYSFHNMKDGQRVASREGSFEGCGLNAFLHSRRLDIKAKSYSAAEVSDAISACEDYYRMIGLDHCAKAAHKFATEVYNNPVYRR